MPSVMQRMRFEKEFARVGREGRDKIVNDFIPVLDIEYKPNATPIELERVKSFEAFLKGVRGLETVPSVWYAQLFSGFTGTSLVDRFMYKMKI